MSTKKEKSVLNMTKFIQSQSLILLGKLNELEDNEKLDELCDLSEELHQLAEEVYSKTREVLDCIEE